MEEMVQLVIGFIISLLVSAAFLWVGMKVAYMYSGMQNGGQYCGFADILTVCSAASLVSMVPYVGGIAAWVVLFYMLKRVTEAEVIELLIMVFVSRVAAILVGTFLIAAL